MPKISIIIPIYNAEKYLKECLDSIINQKLKDIEIICINDGSKDNSIEILNDYKQKDKRIIVINQKNQGAAEARNNGLNISKGEYIIFFDSDDIMENDALEVLYEKIKENNSDIIIAKSYLYNQNKKTIKRNTDSIKNTLLNGKSTFSPKENKKYIFQFAIGWPWDKLYKRDFIIKNDLKFQNLRHSNDTYFVLMSLIYANKISITEKYLFTHRIHNNSLAQTKKNSPECFYFALLKIYKELNKKNLYELYKQSFINYCLEFSYWHIKSINNFKSQKITISYFKEILNKIEFKKYNILYFYSLTYYNYAKNINNKIKLYLENIISINPTEDGKYKLIHIFNRTIKLKIKTNLNRIYLIKENKLKQVKRIKGLKIDFIGNNNVVAISHSCKFSNTKFVLGNNNQILINKMGYFKDSNFLINSNYCNINIDDNTQMFGATLSLRNKPHLNINIGKNCLFSSQVILRTSDGHSIYDINTKELLNMDKDIIIDDNVWLCHNVTILKGVHIASNNIIAAGAIISKDITENNSIYGSVNKCIKKNVMWNIISPERYIKEVNPEENNESR